MLHDTVDTCRPNHLPTPQRPFLPGAPCVLPRRVRSRRPMDPCAVSVPFRPLAGSIPTLAHRVEREAGQPVFEADSRGLASGPFRLARRCGLMPSSDHRGPWRRRRRGIPPVHGMRRRSRCGRQPPVAHHTSQRRGRILPRGSTERGASVGGAGRPQRVVGSATCATGLHARDFTLEDSRLAAR